jgi:hypothetical protein
MLGYSKEQKSHDIFFALLYLWIEVQTWLIAFPLKNDQKYFFVVKKVSLIFAKHLQQGKNEFQKLKFNF